MFLLCIAPLGITPYYYAMESDHHPKQTLTLLSPVTLAQTYHYFAHDIFPPEIAQHIFSFQCDGSSFAKCLNKLEQSISPKRFIKYIKALIYSGGDMLAIEICESFLKRKNISICDIHNEYNVTCLYLTENPKVAQILLRIAGENKDKLLTMQSTMGWTALHSAAQGHADMYGTDSYNLIQIVELILNATDETYNLLTIQDKDGRTPLHIAVKHDSNMDTVKLILDAAKNDTNKLLTMQDKEGQTALHYAVSNNNLYTVFLANERDPDLGEMYINAWHNSIEIAKLLLNAAGNKARDFIWIPNNNGETAFDLANEKSPFTFTLFNPKMQAILQTYMRKEQI